MTGSFGRSARGSAAGKYWHDVPMEEPEKPQTDRSRALGDRFGAAT
jgi:hypothetical protein